MDFSLCAEESRNPEIAVKKKRKRFVILNPERRRVIKVDLDNDDCPLKNQKRCDYFFEIYNSLKLAIYVELKGSDIKKAIKQLEATLNDCKKIHRGFKKNCHVVASRVGGTDIQNLKKKFLRIY